MHSHSNAPALALRAIGMHPKYAGYGYSLAILRITHRHPEYIYRLPKMVYPRIMELFGCTRSALDRNIRFAIERTWENGKPDAAFAIIWCVWNELDPHKH